MIFSVVGGLVGLFAIHVVTKYLVKRYKKRQMYADDDAEPKAQALLEDGPGKGKQYSAVSERTESSGSGGGSDSGSGSESGSDDSDYDEDDELI